MQGACQPHSFYRLSIWGMTDSLFQNWFDSVIATKFCWVLVVQVMASASSTPWIRQSAHYTSGHLNNPRAWTDSYTKSTLTDSYTKSTLTDSFTKYGYTLTDSFGKRLPLIRDSQFWMHISLFSHLPLADFWRTGYPKLQSLSYNQVSILLWYYFHIILEFMWYWRGKVDSKAYQID